MPRILEFARLALAALAWFLLHAAVAGSGARGLLIRRLGEKAYRRGFSFASLVTLWWLVKEYGHAPYVALWSVPRLLHWAPLVVVPLAFVLMVGGFTVRSPTALGGEGLLDADEPARGMLRVTRHPFLWAVLLWSVAHLLVNADAGSLIFFSSLGLTAWRGNADIDRKRRLSNPLAYERFERVTSRVPFAAIIGGRNRLVLREVWLPLVLGLALSIAAIALHPHLFGRSALGL